MIYIVRHGETNWNVSRRLQGHTSVALNENGREEAEVLAERIEKLDFNRIISSDLIRARETAEIINKRVHKDIVFDARLRSIDYGALEGRLISEIAQEEWGIYNSTPEVFGAESVESVYTRVKNLLDELVANDESVLIVTHGGVLRVMSYYIDYKQKFDNEVYCKFYKDVKPVANTSLFEWRKEYTKLKPIYY